MEMQKYRAWSPPGIPTPRSPARLGASEGTVRIHPQNTFVRLQVSSRTAAVTRAFPDLSTT